MTESELIERYFRRGGGERDDVVLGIGDDAALLRVPPECELVLTTDALVEGRHFLEGASPRSLGHRALAVNLSDIAAMGAAPAWALLSLNLPAADDDWLQEFSQAFGALAREQGVALVGGNLTRGPLSITVQLAGLVPAGGALRRDGAQPGDLLYVSGTPGDAALGLALQQAAAGSGGAATYAEADLAWLRARHEFPTARVALGQALRGLASACIDVSDGLYTDARRLLQASGCGATIDVERLPSSPALRRVAGAEGWRNVLAGGEDYELCFTVPRALATKLESAAAALIQPLACIGELTAGEDITVCSSGVVIGFSSEGFDHFRD
ncbi:MAG TPA: thiamine-phosphate kinase [Steroidobacteraceae bacterium]|nr:thiamine-phosphate kinase [Steroidobacteraceae bacterium]